MKNEGQPEIFSVRVSATSPTSTCGEAAGSKGVNPAGDCVAGSERSRIYGSARQTLTASVPRLSVPPPPRIRPLGFHAGNCRWATGGKCGGRSVATDLVRGIAAQDEIEYSRFCGQNRPPTDDVAERRQLLPASVRSHEKTANFASGRREPPEHAPHRARLGVLLSKALRGASRGGALGPRLWFLQGC